MTLVAENETHYLDQWKQFHHERSDASFVSDLRKLGVDSFEKLGFPTRRNEDWRFTNVSPIVQTEFELAGKPDAVEQHRRTIDELTLADTVQIVLVNGWYSSELSSCDSLPSGIIANGLAASLDGHSTLIEPHLGKILDWRYHAFTSLNTAFLHDGAFLYVSRGTVVDQPIQVVFLNDAESPSMCHPRMLVVCERETQITLVERHISVGGGESFSNVATEIVLAESAHLDHYKVQQLSSSAFHIANMQVRQMRRSNFRSHTISLGGRIARSEARVYFEDEGSEATLNGLYVGAGSQHLDHLTRIDHAKPHCNSHELYKGILADRAHGVFTGKIYVHEDAQKTDAKQTNQVLLLSEDATINTKPQLEIYADDVKCTHGATVGQLDADAVFYLRSRGIGLEAARSILTYAFANDILSRIRIDAIRDELEQYLTSKHFTSVQEIKEAL